MRTTLQKRHIRETLADCESMRQMVESLVLGRASGQKRQSPRFPTSTALLGPSVPQPARGQLFALRPLHSPSQAVLPTVDASPATSPVGAVPTGEELLQRISEIRLVNYSEQGLQIELQCENFFQYLDRPMFVQLKERKHPVDLRWYKQTGSLVRCGCSFCGSIDQEPDIASTLIALSNELLAYLVASDPPRIVPPFETVFSCVSVLHNLRLKYLEAVTSFCEARDFILRCLSPRFHRQVAPILMKFEHSRDLQMAGSAGRADDPAYKAALSAVLLPCQELGCGVLGVGEQVLLMRDEVLNLLTNCLLPIDSSSDKLGKTSDIVKPVYKTFQLLRERLPGVFDDPLLDRQFVVYSAVLAEMDHLREQLIDCVSGVGVHWF